MVAPRGSVIEPVSVAELCVCARIGAEKNATRETMEKTRTKTRLAVIMRIPPPVSRGSKRLSACPGSFPAWRLRAPSVSWLGGTAPRGLPIPAHRTVARAKLLRLTVARRRRVYTVFPARSQRWIWRRILQSRRGRDAEILRVNDLAERAKERAPRDKKFKTGGKKFQLRHSERNEDSPWALPTVNRRDSSLRSPECSELLKSRIL